MFVCLGFTVQSDYGKSSGGFRDESEGEGYSIHHPFVTDILSSLRHSTHPVVSVFPVTTVTGPLSQLVKTHGSWA